MRHSRITGAAATPEVNNLQVEPEFVSLPQPYLNRHERRHARPMRFRNGLRVNYSVFVPKPYQPPALNTPYVKPQEEA